LIELTDKKIKNLALEAANVSLRTFRFIKFISWRWQRLSMGLAGAKDQFIPSDSANLCAFFTISREDGERNNLRDSRG
jgi:hypothetical protein